MADRLRPPASIQAEQRDLRAISSLIYSLRERMVSLDNVVAFRRIARSSNTEEDEN